MHAHLVFAHPLPESLGASLAAAAEAALVGRGATVDRLDLYAENFDPRLTPAERIDHYGTPNPPPDVAALQQRLGKADVLVLVFPTWWFGFPAILKGWFDRVWAPGFAYDHGLPIKPRLTSLKACLVITTLGSPWWIDRLVMWNPVGRIMRDALIDACTSKARFEMLALHQAEAVAPGRAEKFRRRIAAAVARLR